MVKKELLLGAVLLVILTLATIWSSLSYHYDLAKEYGSIAIAFVPVLAAGSFIVGFIISIFFQWGVNIIHFDKVVKLLPQDERNVLTTLFNARKMTQAELYAETGLSRVKVSRILSRLEEKGLIIKKSIQNTNLVESRIYREHQTTKLLTKIPGFSETKIIVAMLLILLFGISLSVLNSLHIFALTKPFRVQMYMIAIELLILGALFSFAFRWKISGIHFEKILTVLPDDERTILRIIHKNRILTQKNLTEQTNIHPMKISRILQKLEQTGLIKKRPSGFTNMVISRI